MAGWSELYTNNDSLTSLRVMPNADGRLEVFGINAQGPYLAHLADRAEQRMGRQLGRAVQQH